MTAPAWLPSETVGVPFDEYAAWPELNWSKVKHREHSAAMFHWAETAENEETVARAKGRLTHCLVLEPENLDREFAIWDGGRRGTSAHKAWSAEVAQGRTEIKVNEYEDCAAMADAVRSHPLTQPLFAHGVPEVSLRYTDGRTGLPCKGRLDWVQRHDETSGVIVDLKAFPDIREFAVASQIAKQQWHGQAAHYCHAAARALGWTSVNYVIVGVQINRFHDVGVFNLGNWSSEPGAHGIEYIHAGDLLRRDLLDLIAEDRERGTYPGRYSFEIPLDPPAWATPDGFGMPTGSTNHDDDEDPFGF